MILKNPKNLENNKKVSNLKYLSRNFQKRWFFLELFKSYKLSKI